MELENKPTHVAIIPDGNRRWARKKGLEAWNGHEAGSKTFEDILQKALDLKIPYITFWGASWDNLTKRTKPEVNFLFKEITKRFQNMVTDKRMHENKVQINVFGRWKEILPDETQAAINQAMEATKDYNNHFVTFLLAYDGTQEMIDAVQKIIDQDKGAKVDADLIKNNLWTAKLPPVDLLIRTGVQGDPHNSAGFMMWHTAYSQLLFTEILFPDFDGREFEKAIVNYSQRQRRMGK